jgi:hypothetical protein
MGLPSGGNVQLIKMKDIRIIRYTSMAAHKKTL